MRYDKLPLVGLTREISFSLPPCPGGHGLFYGTYEWTEQDKRKREYGVPKFRIWTQIGSDEESTTNPSIDIVVYEDRVKIDSDDKRLCVSWNLIDYDLTRKIGFKQLMEDINEVIEAYYKQFVEQNRYIKRPNADIIPGI